VKSRGYVAPQVPLPLHKRNIESTQNGFLICFDSGIAPSSKGKINQEFSAYELTCLHVESFVEM